MSLVRGALSGGNIKWTVVCMNVGLRRKAWARHVNLGVCLEYAGDHEGNGEEVVTGKNGRSTGLSPDLV